MGLTSNYGTLKAVRLLFFFLSLAFEITVDSYACVRNTERSRVLLLNPTRGQCNYSTAAPQSPSTILRSRACLVTPTLTPQPGSSASVKHGSDGSPFCALAPPQQEVAWEVDRLQGDPQLPGDGQVKQRHADGDPCSAGQHLRKES